MNKDFAVMMVFFTVSAALNVGLGIAWFSAFRRLRRLERREEALLEPDERSIHLERALESLAGQVDQLANAQEFLNRVIAERKAALPLGRVEPPNDITPH